MSLSLRVGTWNVHQWHHADEGNLDPIVTLLANAKLDVIGLQECTRAKLPELADSLGMPFYTFHRSVAILSRHELVDLSSSSSSLSSLSGGKRSSSNNNQLRLCRVGMRVAQNDCGELKEGGGNILVKITCLHLDHVKESTRMEQILQLLTTLVSTSSDDRKNNNQHNTDAFDDDLWLGDFNALTKSDYTTREWHAITETRNLNSWEAPSQDVTTFLTYPRTAKMMTTIRMQNQQHQHKSTPKKSRKKKINKSQPKLQSNHHGNAYKNNCRLTMKGGGLGFSDVWQQMTVENTTQEGNNNDNNDNTEQQLGPNATSRFGTRIDYIFASSTFLKSWAIDHCHHVQAIPTISDHNLVVAQFAKRREGGYSMSETGK